MQANPYQRRAIEAPGHCTILACPGSGKTKVLAERAAFLLNHNQIGRVCAVTFTKDASKELLTRITSSCGTVRAKRVAVGTFHSLALNQIKRSAGQTEPPRIISAGERFAIIRRCWKEFAPNETLDNVLAIFDAAKSTLEHFSFNDLQIEKAFIAFEKIMSLENVMDFSDILIKAVHGMRDGSIQPLPVKWLLVDEGQDMDEVQLQWILEHGKHGIEVTLVGDDDQSLYSFRNALGYEGLQTVSSALGSVELTLPVNYRCAPNILRHAATLICKNEHRAAKNIQAAQEKDGVISVVRAADREGEAAYMADELSCREKLGEWAVLARTNSILDVVEAELSAKGIPVQRHGTKSMWERGIGSIFFGLLSSIYSASWLGIASAMTFCGIKDDWANEISRTSESEDIFTRLSYAIDQAKDEKTQRICIGLREGLIAWRTQHSKGRTSMVISGVASFLNIYAKEKQRSLLESLRYVLGERMSGTLGQRLSSIARNEHKEKRALNGKVNLLTLHSSKGLEFDHVWLFACEEGTLPHEDSGEQDERRLMYVGMTRAKESLFISSSVDKGSESRFIAEAGL